MADDLYQEIILAHYKEPRNFGSVKNFDQEITEANQSCGDVFRFQVKFIERKGQWIVEQIKFQGQGCAISTAAGSMLMEQLVGKPVDEIRALNEADMQDLIGAEVTATRLKCLLLPLRAVKKLIKEKV